MTCNLRFVSYLAPTVLQHLIDKKNIDIYDCYPSENKYGPYEGQDLQWDVQKASFDGTRPKKYLGELATSSRTTTTAKCLRAINNSDSLGWTVPITSGG